MHLESETLPGCPLSEGCSHAAPPFEVAMIWRALLGQTVSCTTAELHTMPDAAERCCLPLTGKEREKGWRPGWLLGRLGVQPACALPLLKAGTCRGSGWHLGGNCPWCLFCKKASTSQAPLPRPVFQTNCPHVNPALSQLRGSYCLPVRSQSPGRLMLISPPRLGSCLC